MIWWGLGFAALVWWVGVRIGSAMDGIESHFTDKPGAPRAGAGDGARPHVKVSGSSARP